MPYVKHIILAIISLFLLFSLAGYAEETAVDAERCRSLIDSKCVACHYKSRICYALGKKSKRRWRRTINNMVDYGTRLTDKEIETITDCLYKAAPNTPYACKNTPLKKETK